MENRLITMVDFVLKANTTLKSNSDESKEVLKFWDCIKYAKFLNTPLNIGMFVPAIEVDGKWEVLEEPEKLNQSDPYIETIHAQTNLKQWKQYQKAKDKLIFEGFKEFEFNKHRTIKKTNEHLFIAWLEDGKYKMSKDLKNIESLVRYEPTLTPYGMELSGLNR